MTTTKPKPAAKASPVELAQQKAEKLALELADLDRAIEDKDREWEAAKASGDFAQAAALEQAVIHLRFTMHPELCGRHQQALQAVPQARVQELLDQAAALRQQVAERDARTADARALIESEEGVAFSWLEDGPLVAGSSSPHWSNGFKRGRGNLPAGDCRSQSEKDLDRALELEREARQLAARSK